MKKSMVVLGALLSSGIVVGTVSAQTLDGRTPAVEQVCGDVKGTANGICLAYCEAQDCDMQPNKNSCAQLRINYAKHTGSPIFPCDPRCGDGVVNQAAEDCDDGNNAGCDGCSPTCTLEYCGDGIVCPGEACEPGGLCADGSACLVDCTCSVPPECPCGTSCTATDGRPGSCLDQDGDGVCACVTNPECEGQTCDTFTACNPGTCNGNGVCGSTAEGEGICVDGTTPCDGLTDCTTNADCPSGWCIVDSCCVRAVCVPDARRCR